MTQHILVVNHHLQTAIKVIANQISTLFYKAFNAILEGQQRKADYEIAKLLQKEFPGEDLQYIYTLVRRGDINDLIG